MFVFYPAFPVILVGNIVCLSYSITAALESSLTFVFLLNTFSYTTFVFYLCFWSFVVSTFCILPTRAAGLASGLCVQCNWCLLWLCDVEALSFTLRGSSWSGSVLIISEILSSLSALADMLRTQNGQGRSSGRPFSTLQPSPLRKFSLACYIISPQCFSQVYFPIDLWNWLSNFSILLQNVVWNVKTVTLLVMFTTIFLVSTTVPSPHLTNQFKPYNDGWWKGGDKNQHSLKIYHFI